MLAPWKKCYDQYRQHIEEERLEDQKGNRDKTIGKINETKR